MTHEPRNPRDRQADRHKRICAFDRGWQFPAITELHAYRRMQEIGGVPAGMIYVAYPWATLIDKLQVNAADARMHLDSFRAFCLGLPEAAIRITVCQHILMPRFRHLFEEAGITDLFWSHVAQPQADALDGAALRVHPFPLYPVQIPTAAIDAAKTGSARRWLFSFIGMRPNAWYLTDVRAFILDRLATDPRGFVTGRSEWHYKQIVYRHQIFDQAPEDGLVDVTAEDQFRTVLTDSTFALCPSGSGPNSIRLWEAIMAGTIPVILSETYVPPGDPDLWAAATVNCAETEDAVQALPEKLAAIADDPARLAAMRTALAKLRDRYAPVAFITDIEEMIRAPALTGPELPQSKSDAIRLLLARITVQLTGQGHPPPAPALAQALKMVDPAHPVRQHYDKVMGPADR